MSAPESSKPLVSIVVRMYNEALHLDRLFAALKAQSLREFEIIAVDSGSTDGSMVIAQRECNEVLSIQSEDFTFGYSLNQGVARAKGKYVAIISAHAYPAVDSWLQCLLDALTAEPNRALVYGRQLGVPDSKRAERHDFAVIFGDQLVVQRPPNYHCNNANSMIRRDLWEQHRYDESLSGLEDQAWAKYWMDRGMEIAYVPGAVIHHVHNESWHQVENRHYREAVAARHIGIVGRRDLPREFVRFGSRVSSDIAKLASSKDLTTHAIQEVARYRVSQFRGTVRGILHDMQKREERDAYFPDKNPAVVIRGPGDAVYGSVAMPLIKPNDVLIRVAAVGVCSTDIEVYRGTLGYFKNGMSAYPIVPGHEYAGQVIATGAKVSSHLKPGTQVVGECILTCMKCDACLAGRTTACTSRREVGVMRYDGAYAAYVALPQQFVHVVPPAEDIRKYALVEPLAVCHKAVSRLSSNGGKTRQVGVIGAGPIGNFCAQLLDKQGHRVTVFEPNKARLDYLGRASIARETRMSGLGRFDTFVETTGKADVLEALLSQSPADSEILLLGFPYGERTFNFEDVVSFDRKIIGSVGSSSKDFKAAIDLVPSLTISPFMQRIIPVGQYEEAWREHESRRFLKIMLAHEAAA